MTVAITPNGYADALTFRKESNEEYFVMPEEKSMLMRSFLDTLEHPKENFVCYIQRQNSNMGDFPELANDIPSDVNWATEAFGEKPDAVNFWMGDSRAVTSCNYHFYLALNIIFDIIKEYTTPLLYNIFLVQYTRILMKTSTVSSTEGKTSY